jgi:hypothetical protein
LTQFQDLVNQLCYNSPVGEDITNIKLNRTSFEDSKWLLVNIWTGIFLAAGGSAKRLVEPTTYSAKTAVNSQGL